MALPTETKQQHRRRRRSKSAMGKFGRFITRKNRWRVLLITIVMLLTIPAALAIFVGTDAVARIRESISDVSRVVGSVRGIPFGELKQADIERLRASVSKLTTDLTNAKLQTGGLRIFSALSSDLRSIFSLLDVSTGLSLSAQDVIDGLQPVFYALIPASGTVSSATAGQTISGERLIELLRLGHGKFVDARLRLDEIKRDIYSPDVVNVSPQLLLQVEQVQLYFDQLDAVTSILVDSPELISHAFGVAEPQHYLVLSANNDELRPSGGYLSTYGWLNVRRFSITDYGYSPTTATSPNPPPATLVNELNIPPWWIHFREPIYTAWDGSWYADFPSTAQMSIWYYEQGRNPLAPVDGVISIDITGFETLLGALGNVYVDGNSQPVNSSNFREVIYKIRAEGEGIAHKEYLVTLYRAILAQWQSISRANGQELLNAFMKALQEKHILIYFKDERLNDLMDLLGWSGRQEVADGDYLMVADANLGNKSNHSIDRTLTYDVQIQPDGTLKSRLSITYDYSADLAASDPAVRPEHYGSQIDYFNLFQTFVPKGSVLTSTNNITSPVTDTTGDATVFVSSVVVAFDTTERFQFQYTTPIVVKSIGPYKEYRLLIQKQPGTHSDSLIVQVMLPAGATTISITPEPVALYTVDKPILEFRLRGNVDQKIEIQYQ